MSVLPVFYFAVQNNTPECTCSCQRLLHLANLNPNSYLKLSATLFDLDGLTVFDTGCSGCCSLRRRIASFKREDTEACELPAAILRSWACLRYAYLRFAPLRYASLRDDCLRDACALCLFAFCLCVLPLCVMPLCVMPACVMPLCYEDFKL